MASSRAIAVALGTFAETFPTREVSPRTADVWSRVFVSVDDDVLGRAVLRLCRDPQRRFFPATGEVFAAIAAESQSVDAATIIHRIEKLGHYNPSRGWVYPTDAMVREALGDAVADAYRVAGGPTCMFAESKDGNATTREIAEKTFAVMLDQKLRHSSEQLMLPAPVPAARMIEPPRERMARLGKGDGPLAGIVRKVASKIDRDTAA